VLTLQLLRRPNSPRFTALLKEDSRSTALQGRIRFSRPSPRGSSSFRVEPNTDNSVHRGGREGRELSVGVEALFTSALGLQAPWVVEDVSLDVVKRRVDFEIGCQGTALACPACGAAAQRVHDRLRRSWRHLDFFQFEAWLHCDVPRIACGGCGKTTQMPVPWARPGSGFTAAFEALALTLCRQMPVRQAAALLRCADKQLWKRIEFYVGQARALERLDGVSVIGVDETSLRRGQEYITVVHDLNNKGCCSRPKGEITRPCSTSRPI
jgi:hypothetical protein